MTATKSPDEASQAFIRKFLDSESRLRLGRGRVPPARVVIMGRAAAVRQLGDDAGGSFFCNDTFESSTD